MKAKLILIRGLPGSGKTTLAQKLMDEAENRTCHYEADMFFVDDKGEYQFDAEKLSEAHHWCRKQTRIALSKRQNVIVSNTFVKKWELQPYLNLARQFKASVEIKECTARYANIHNVPPETIEKMRLNWETL